MIKQLLAISLLVAANLSHAAANKLTIHSRNNCGNNESISWDGTKYWHLGTNSHHTYKDGKTHVIGSGIAQTWRSAAVHYGEGIGGWVRVQGEHYLFQDGSTKYVIWYKITDVRDCDIYTGWWEFPAPKP
jgi:hypothetical protein